MLFLVVATVSLLLLDEDIMLANLESYNTLDTQITFSTELDNVSHTDIEGIKKEIRIALNSIPPILGIEYKKNTKINIVDKGFCYADRGTVSLSVSHIRDNSAPIIHEVVHILTKHAQNSFFSEGLAVYFQERFGGSDSFLIFQYPLMNYFP